MTLFKNRRRTRKHRLLLRATFALVDGSVTLDPALTSLARVDAALTIETNGRPIATWTSADATVSEPLRVALALDTFDAPFEFGLSATTPLADDPECIDPGHVARWIDLGDPTIAVTARPESLNVARAIHGMGQLSALTNEPISVVLSDPRNSSQLEAAGHTVAAISRNGRPSYWHLASGSTAGLPTGAAVLISTNDAPATITLHQVADRPVLVLQGQEREVVEIARALSDPNRTLFFDRQTLGFMDLPPVEVTAPAEVFTFSEEGFDDRAVRGFGEQRLIYRIHIPAGVPPDSASIALFATHAPSMASFEAAFTVQINGSAEEVVAVATPRGELEILHDITPADLRPGLNFVTIEAQLGSQPLSGSGACGSASLPNWMTVSNNSALGVNRPVTPAPVDIGVQDARFALASQVDFMQSDVVIGDDASNEDIAVAFNVISALAERAQGGSPRLVTESMAALDRHLVVVGKDPQRVLLSDLPYLDRNSSVGVIAATASPYADGRVFLAFASGTNEGLHRTVEAAMSASVNDIETPFALVSELATRGVDSELTSVPGTRSASNPVPSGLAFRDDERLRGPADEQYEDWILEQADLIEAAQAPEANRRRTIALTIGMIAVLIVAGGWLRQARSNDDLIESH